MTRTIAWTALLVVAASACGSDGPTGGDPPPAQIDFVGTVSSTPLRGNATGTQYVDGCPSGHAVIGYRGANALTASGFLGQIQAVCGVPTVSGGASPTVTIATSVVTELRGTRAAASWTAHCPVNQVVVGFGGRSGDLIDQLVIRCAPLLVSGAAGAAAISVGATTDIPAVGGTGGAPFAQTDCEAGKVAVVSQIWAATIVEGGVAIAGFGLGCRTVAIVSS